MNRLSRIIIPNLIAYAFFIGLLLAAACLIASYNLSTDSRIGSLLINLSGDFIMAGITISIIDRIIKRYERQKFGNVPDTAKSSINKEVWLLIGALSFSVNGILKKSSKEIIDSIIADTSHVKLSMSEQMRLMDIAQLAEIDESKVTCHMFSEMLRFIGNASSRLDKLISRYEMVLDSEDLSKAIELRDKLEKLQSQHQLITLTATFFGKSTPDKLLKKSQLAAYISIKDGIVSLKDDLFKVVGT